MAASPSARESAVAKACSTAKAFSTDWLKSTSATAGSRRARAARFGSRGGHARRAARGATARCACQCALRFGQRTGFARIPVASLRTLSGRLIQNDPIGSFSDASSPADECAAEYRVPVRKPSKSIDDRLVRQCIAAPTLASPSFSNKASGTRLILPILAVLERQVEKLLRASVMSRSCPWLRALSPDSGPGRSCGIGTRRAAEQISGELIQHDDRGQQFARGRQGQRRRLG